jgi:hypothetical protein
MKIPQIHVKREKFKSFFKEEITSYYLDSISARKIMFERLGAENE